MTASKIRVQLKGGRVVDFEHCSADIILRTLRHLVVSLDDVEATIHYIRVGEEANDD